MPELEALCGAAIPEARSGEQVEAFAQEARHTSVRARAGEVEGLTMSEQRGVGVRLISEGRVGFAWVADPSLDEVRATVARARENAALAEADEHNGLPVTAPIEQIPALFHDELASLALDEKVKLALALEHRATSIDPRVRSCEDVSYGDAISRVAISSTEGMAAMYARTDTWCAVVALAGDDGETQTGYSFRIGRDLGELPWEQVADEAVDRATSMLGATKPPSANVPVVLDAFAGSAFLGVLASALSAESVQKGRSLFADRVGDQVGSQAVTLVDDGRELAGPAAAPFDDEGVPTGRTELMAGGVLRGFLHNTYTAHRQGAGTRSTGNGERGGFRSSPGVGTTNFFVAPGTRPPAELFASAAGGVVIHEVSGVHSGANPISGTFSGGATGRRIDASGAPGEPLREMTIASTIPEMLASVVAVGNDLRFFSSVGVPTILIGEMTVAGV